MAVRWFIARNKEKVGPFSPGDLKQLARFGLLLPTEHVWVEGATKWVEAGSVPGLFPQVQAKKYWLMLSGKAHGPYVADQVKAGLNAHLFNLETQACTDAERQWVPLRQLEDFKDFMLETVPMTPSRALLFVGSLEFEEASMHLAGKAGDELARLISTLLEMKRNYANNVALLENLDITIAALRAKREGLK